MTETAQTWNSILIISITIASLGAGYIMARLLSGKDKDRNKHFQKKKGE